MVHFILVKDPMILIPCPLMVFLCLSGNVPRKMSPGAVPHALGHARTQGEVRHQRLAAAARMVRPWEFACQTWFDVGTCNDIWDDVESTNWRLSTTLWTPWTLGLRHLEAHMAIPNPVSWARVWEVEMFIFCYKWATHFPARNESLIWWRVLALLSISLFSC